MDLGGGGRDAGALPGVVHRSRLRGRSLVQVGEKCNTSTPRYKFYNFIFIFKGLPDDLDVPTRRVETEMAARLKGPT